MDAFIVGEVTPVEVRDHRRELTIPEIFEYLHYKLQTRERNDNFHRNNGTERGQGYRSPNRDSRSVRIADSGQRAEKTGASKERGGRSLSPPSRNSQTPGSVPASPASTRASTPTNSRPNTPPVQPQQSQRSKSSNKGKSTVRSGSGSDHGPQTPQGQQSGGGGSQITTPGRIHRTSAARNRLIEGSGWNQGWVYRTPLRRQIGKTPRTIKGGPPHHLISLVSVLRMVGG